MPCAVREDLREPEPFYILRTFVCDDCKLVQIEDVQPPEQHFHGSYTYFSSFSKSWVEHAKRYAEMMIERFKLGSQSRVIEVASNDGYLLQYFKARGVPVLGIDPAANCAEVAERERGIPTLVRFFGRKTADGGRRPTARPTSSPATTCWRMCPTSTTSWRGSKILLKDTGVITIEFPHLLQLIEASYFDTIYHEHYSYLSLLAVERLFARHGLTVFDVEELPTHGGSLRIFAGHQGSTPEASERLKAFRAREAAAGLDELASLRRASPPRCATPSASCSPVSSSSRKRVRASSPTARRPRAIRCSTTAASGAISSTTRSTPARTSRACCCPAPRIPVYAPERIFETKPDYVLILPWNLKDEIIAQMDGHPRLGRALHHSAAGAPDHRMTPC